jgi:Uma2 family endonuclease
MTVMPTRPDHLLSLDEWIALPESSEWRFELAEYAEAGVPAYLVVEPGPPVVLTEFRLVDDAYELVAEHRGHAPLQLGVTLDLDALD